MQKHNETNKRTRKRTSGYNPNREHHAGDDCLTYTYARWNEEKHGYDKIVLTAGQDGVTEDIILLLDQMDHDGDLGDRYEEENKDQNFERKLKKYENNPDDDGAVNPWDELEDRNADLTDDAERREPPENPDAAKIREVVENDFTPEQQDLFFSHYGECKQLEQIRREEAARTGKPVTPQAMNNRKKKMIRKAAKKAFGVEPVKRRKKD